MMPGQKEDLEKMFSSELVWLTHQNVVWATEDDDSVRSEFARLRTLVGDDGILAGVFPPVALSVARKGVRKNGLRLFSPVSRQTREEREDGEAVIKFHHVRWVEL